MAIIILRLQIYKNESETATFSPFSLGHLQNPVLIFTTDSSDKHGFLCLFLAKTLLRSLRKGLAVGKNIFMLRFSFRFSYDF